MSMFYEIWDAIKRKYRWFEIGIIITIKWLPVIWNDRQWDQVFFYEIVRKKLLLMEDAFRNKHCHVGSEKEADNIKRCILILDRLIKADYDVYKYHNQKWGEPKFNWKNVPEEDYCELNINHPSITTSKGIKQEKEEFKRLSLHENYLINQDLEYLFYIIRKHVQKWWD